MFFSFGIILESPFFSTGFKHLCRIKIKDAQTHVVKVFFFLGEKHLIYAHVFYHGYPGTAVINSVIVNIVVIILIISFIIFSKQQSFDCIFAYLEAVDCGSRK